MKHQPDTTPERGARGERGASRLSFLVVVAVIVVVVYAGYQIVPVMYNASLYKVYMQDTVDKAVATGKDQEWVRAQLGSAGAEEYGVPQNPIIEMHVTDGRMVVRVRWVRPIVLPGYVYNYDFDHTVKSGKFLSSQ